MPSYLTTQGLLTSTHASLFSVLCTGTMMVLIPIFGALLDTFGRARLMKIGYILSGLVTPCLFWILTFRCTGLALLVGIIYSACLAVFMGSMNTYCVELFSVKTRYRNFAIFYSLGMGFCGGTAPFIGSLISTLDYHSLFLTIYSLLGLTMGFVGVALSDQSTKTQV